MRSGENVIDCNIVSVSFHYFIREINVPFQVKFRIQTGNHDLVNVIQRTRLFLCLYLLSLFFKDSQQGLEDSLVLFLLNLFGSCNSLLSTFF